MNDQNTNRKILWKPFLRQLMISSGSWTLLFILGLSTGAPTVLIPQLRKEANSTDAVTEDMSSWLRAAHSYASIPWMFILSALVTSVGLKISQIVVATFTVLSYLVFYFSENVYHILICEILKAPLIASPLTVSLIVITEYTSARYRGFFLSLKSATFFWGVLVSNAIGTYLHWRNIPLLGLLCATYTLVTALFWPETPIWFAKRKRFDECAKSHRWLKGSDRETENELNSLIIQYKHVRITKSLNMKARVSGTVKILLSKCFYKPVLICLLLLTSGSLSGKFVCTIYAIEIMRKITKFESTAYSGMLILDGVTVACMYLSCFITKTFRRRTLLFSTSGAGVAFLLSISLYLYLVKLSIIEENSYLCITLLGAFSIAISCGLITLSSCVTSELLPYETIGLSMVTISVVYKGIYGTFMKLVPYVFKWFEIYGTFLFFAVSVSACLVLLYIYLPETKDKTSQEIAAHFNSIKPLEDSNKLIPTKANDVIIRPNN